MHYEEDSEEIVLEGHPDLVFNREFHEVGPGTATGEADYLRDCRF